MDKKNYPKPDYLSSSRKRLAPQLIYKGGILKSWGKKTAVILNKGFFDTLPPMSEVTAKEADMAWFVYDLVPDTANKRYILTNVDTVYTKFKDALEEITKSQPGDQSSFLQHLQGRLDEKLGGTAEAKKDRDD